MTHWPGSLADASDWRRAAYPASIPRWVEPLAVAILGLALAYTVIGVIGDDPTDTGQTDRVSPINSWIWLGLLTMSLPILKERWRQVVGLALSNWPLLILYGYFALSVTWALDPGASLRRILFASVQLALFTILMSGIRRAPLVHVVIVVVCTALAVADLLSWIVAPGYAMAEDGFAGLQGQKNQTGLLMMYACLAAVPCIFLLRRRMWQIVIGGATIIMAALLVATRSTTSQSVVISAAVVMPMILLVAKLPKRSILALAAVLVLVAVACPLAYLIWCSATGTDPMLPLRGVTFTERTDIWSFVVDEIGKRPLLGSGYQSFWGIDPAVQPSLKTAQWFGLYVIITEAHNGFLDELATGGVIGLFGVLFVLFRSIIMAGQAVGDTPPAAQAWRDGSLAYPTAAFYLALLLGLIVHNFTESNLFSNNGLLAVAFLLATLDLEKWRIARRAARFGPRRPASSA